MSLEQVRDRCIRLDLLGLRWAWALVNHLRRLGRQTQRRSWTISPSSRTASPRRTIGMATVTPEMVAEASVAAGWPPVMNLQEAAEAMRISPQTLRRYVSEGKFKKSVKRGWPVLFWRDLLLSEFMKGPPR